MKGRKPEIGKSSEAAELLEGRFAFGARAVSDIDKTKLQIAHPGWVQLTAAHPAPELPALTAPRQQLLPAIERRGADARQVGLSLAMPEIGNRKKKPDEK